MPLLGFKEQFVPKVEAGLRREPGGKRQTIRQRRKHPIRAGQTLILAKGVRTPGYSEIGRATCVSAEEIIISEDGYKTEIAKVVLGGRCLSRDEVYQLSEADGFEWCTSFLAFFRDNYGLPFSGVLIKW